MVLTNLPKVSLSKRESSTVSNFALRQGGVGMSWSQIRKERCPNNIEQRIPV